MEGLFFLPRFTRCNNVGICIHVYDKIRGGHYKQRGEPLPSPIRIRGMLGIFDDIG